MHYFIMKVANTQEFQQMVFNNSPDNDFQDFMNLLKNFTVKPYFFLMIDTILVLDRIF